jgi:hypothetical protein
MIFFMMPPIGSWSAPVGAVKIYYEGEKNKTGAACAAPVSTDVRSGLEPD